MKKKIAKKLALSKETLRNLSEGEMKEVAGGKPPVITVSCGDCITNADTGTC